MNNALKSKGQPSVAPVAAASVVGVTPAPEPVPVPAAPAAPPPRPAMSNPAAPVPTKAPACSLCNDTGRVIFVEKGRGLKSVGPCSCVKA